RKNPKQNPKPNPQPTSLPSPARAQALSLSARAHFGPARTPPFSPHATQSRVTHLAQLRTARPAACLRLAPGPHALPASPADRPGPLVRLAFLLPQRSPVILAEE